MAATIDSLNIQISAQAKNAQDSLDKLSTKLTSLSNKVGKLNGQGLNKFATKLKDLDKLNFNGKGITNLVNSFKRLESVDMSKFSARKFSGITKGIRSLGDMPDISSSVNRFVSSLQKLVASGNSISVVASKMPALGNALESTARRMASVSGISDSVNSFVSAMGRLASAGNRTGQTAAQLDSLADATLGFFQRMKSAPRISQNTVAMTQALAQLAQAGGKAKTATNTVAKAFSRISSIGSKTANAIKKAASTIVSSLSKIGRGNKTIQSATFSLKNLLKTAIGFRALQGLKEFGKSSVKLASDLTETQNVVDVTFGDFKNKIEDLAKVSIPEFGMSELTAKKISSRFQAMGTAMGFTKGNMADMSVELTKLAADMASFYNVSQEDVAKSLESIFTGQTRPLRAYGMDLTQATLQEWAMKKGLDANVQSMSQAEKTMLRYQYVMENSAAAHGDFARTSGSYANQVRVLTQNFKQMASVVGQGLIAALTPAIQRLNSLLAVLNKAAYAFRDFMYALTGNKAKAPGGIVNTEELDSVEESAENAASGVDTATNSVKDLGKALSVLSFDELNQLSSNKDESDASAPSTSTPSADFSGLATAVEDLANYDVESPISRWAERIKKAFKSHDWHGIGVWVADNINSGMQKIYDVINQSDIVQKVATFSDAFATAFNAIIYHTDFDLIGRTVGAGVNMIVDVANNLVTKINWENIGTQFSNGFNGLVSEVNWSNLGNLIGNGFMAAFNMLYGFVANLDWAGVGIAFADAITGMFQTIDLSRIAEGAALFLNGISTSLVNFSAAVPWGEIGNSIANSINTFFSTWDPALMAEGISSFFLSILELISSTVEGMEWRTIGEKIAALIMNIDAVKILEKAASTISDLLSGVLDLTIGFVEKMDWGKVGKNIWNALVGVVQSIEWGELISKGFELLGAALAASVKLIVGFAQGLWDSLKSAFERTKEYFSKYIDESGGSVIKGLLNGMWNGMKNIGSWIKDHIFSPFINGFKKAFGIGSGSSMLQRGKELIADFLGGLKNKFTDVVTWLTGLPKVFREKFSRVADVIKHPINSMIGLFEGLANKIIDAWNWIKGAVNTLSFDVPDWVPGIGGKTFGFNLDMTDYIEIPRLAKGGLVQRETLARIGEYNRNEAVLPLENDRTMSYIASSIVGNMDSRQGGIIDEDAFVNKIVNGIVTAMQMSQQSSGGNPSYIMNSIEIDGETIARAVTRGQQSLDARYNPTPKFGY